MISEENNYKYLFFKEVYNELNLKSIEDGLLKEKIKPLNVIQGSDYEIISNYFFLLNEPNLQSLNSIQLEEFHDLFSKKISDLTEVELKKALDFINSTYTLMLFPNVDTKYVYYGSVSDNYICPKDAIAIGLYYDAFTECEDFEITNKLARVINYIQFDLAKKINKRVAVILFNQLTLENRHDNFVK